MISNDIKPLETTKEKKNSPITLISTNLKRILNTTLKNELKQHKNHRDARFKVKEYKMRRVRLLIS